MKSSRWVVAVAAVAFAWPCAVQATEKVEFAVLLAALDQMAVREHSFVTKWDVKAPLKIKIQLPLTDAGAKVLDYTLQTITANSGLTFQRDDTEEKPDISIAYDIAKLFMGASPAGGLTRATWSKYGGQMRKAEIVLQKYSDPYHLNRLIPHEMMHAIGFNEHAQGFDSISSYFVTRYSFSDWDQLFMRVLYDSRLKVGMPRVFALPLMCRLLHEKLVAENNTYVTDLARQGAQPYCDELAAQPVVARKPLDEIRFGWAYLIGNGVVRDVAQAEKWAAAAQAKNEPDAPRLMEAVEKLKAMAQTRVAKTPPASPVLDKADFRPAAVGTTFVIGTNRKGYLKIDRIEGTTIHTVNADNAPFRWAAMFFGRAPRFRVDPAEDKAAAIWPLEVGKTVEFDHGGTFRHVLRVLRTESVQVDKRQIPTFVVERRTTRLVDEDAPPYEGVFTFWYAPELGFPAKYETRFTGKTTEKPVSWTVSEVRPAPTAP